MFTNIALLSKPGPELQAIRQHLRNPVKYLVREYLSIDDVNKGLTNYPFDVLLVRLDVFDSKHVNMLLRIRARFPEPGLVTMSPEVQPSARYQVREISRHKLLHEPMELPDLPQVIDKLSRKDPGATRLHPRVSRDGDCELVNIENGTRIKAHFLDFAQMGARLQLLQPNLAGDGAPLRRNSRYQLHYRSTTEPNRIHRIESSIAWAEVNSGMMGTLMNGPQQVVGLRFIAAL